MKFIPYILLTAVAFSVSSGCTKDEDTVDPMSDSSLSLRKVTGRYYGNLNFRIGMYEPYDNLMATDSIARKRQDIYYAEFGLGLAAEKFRQEIIAPTGDDRMWNSAPYKFLLGDSRNQEQVLLPEAPIGPRCSEWVHGENRTAEELEGLIRHYVSTMSTDMQLNNDVVRSMVVAEEIFSEDAENPWLVLGMDNGPAGVIYPHYLSLTLDYAARYAPSIKFLISQRAATPGDAVWEKVKNTVLALKAGGHRVDGICWNALVPMGWEKDPENRKDLLRLVDWCYLNNVEFHVTHLTVIVSKGMPVEDVDGVAETRERQAATYAAVTEAVASRAGRGAASLSFGTLNGYFAGGVTYAGLYDADLTPTAAYEAVRRVLIETAKQ